MRNLLIALCFLVLGLNSSLAQEVPLQPCHPTDSSPYAETDEKEEVKNALAILKRECAKRNDCSPEEDLQAVEKILFGVAETVAGDEQGYLDYLKEKISIGLKVITGSYDMEKDDPFSNE